MFWKCGDVMHLKVVCCTTVNLKTWCFVVVSFSTVILLSFCLLFSILYLRCKYAPRRQFSLTCSCRVRSNVKGETACPLHKTLVHRGCHFWWFEHEHAMFNLVLAELVYKGPAIVVIFRTFVCFWVSIFENTSVYSFVRLVLEKPIFGTPRLFTCVHTHIQICIHVLFTLNRPIIQP